MFRDPNSTKIRIKMRLMSDNDINVVLGGKLELETADSHFAAHGEFAYALFSSLGVVVACQTLVVFLSLLLKFKRNLARPVEICVMSLGVGTMVADAMMHIIPEAIQGHSHNASGYAESHDHGHGHNHASSVYLGMSAIAGMIFVILAEFVVHSLHHVDWGAKRSKGGPEEEDLMTKISEQPTTHTSHTHNKNLEIGDINLKPIAGSKQFTPKKTVSTTDINSPDEAIPSSSEDLQNTSVRLLDSKLADVIKHDPHDQEHQCRDHEHHHNHGFAHMYESEEDPTKLHDERQERVVSACFANAVAEIVHNVVDGLAIGIAFKGGYATGVATSICILAHEVPMQFTDYVLFLKAGFGFVSACFMNILIASFVMVGASIPSLGSNPNVQKHLLMATGGNFLALSFFQLLPEIRGTILDEEKGYLYWLSGLFLCLGVFCIALLGFMEDYRVTT